MVGFPEPGSQRVRSSEAMALLSGIWLVLPEEASVLLLLPGGLDAVEFFSRIACAMMFFLGTKIKRTEQQ